MDAFRVILIKYLTVPIPMKSSFYYFRRKSAGLDQVVEACQIDPPHRRWLQNVLHFLEYLYCKKTHVESIYHPPISQTQNSPLGSCVSCVRARPLYLSPTFPAAYCAIFFLAACFSFLSPPATSPVTQRVLFPNTPVGRFDSNLFFQNNASDVLTSTFRSLSQKSKPKVAVNFSDRFFWKEKYE